MDFPVGSVVEQLQETKTSDFSQKLSVLQQQNFTGYIVETIDGVYGLEEGMLFMKQGQVIACLHRFESNGYELRGQEALQFFFNGARATGFFDVVQLSNQQIDLVTAFDEKLLLTQQLDLKDLTKLIPVAYSTQFVENYFQQKK